MLSTDDITYTWSVDYRGIIYWYIPIIYRLALNKWLTFHCCKTFHVTIQVWWSIKCLVKIFTLVMFLSCSTLVMFLSCMYSHMSCQGWGVSEWFTTHFTHVRFLSRVYPHVSWEGWDLSEWFTSVRMCRFSLLCVVLYVWTRSTAQ